MNKTLTLFKYRFIQAIRKVIDFKNDPLLKQLVISFFIFGYLFGGFFLLYKFFNFVNSITPVGGIILDRLFYVYFFILFIMLIVSSLIIGYSTFFRIRETEFLFYLPLKISELWLYKFIKVIFMSSWAFLFLSIPVVISFGIVKKADIYYYFLTAISLFPFLVITSCLGVAVLFAFLKIVPKKYAKYFLTFFFMVMIYTIFQTIPRGTYYESTNIIFIINTLLKHTDITLNKFLPSSWMAGQQLMSLERDYKGFFSFFLLSLSNALFMTVNIYYFASKVYPKLYTEERSHGQKKYYRNIKLFQIIRKIMDRLFPRKYVAIITKDFTSFVRDPMQWSQFLVFFGLIFLYVINLKNMKYDLDDPFWKNLITFFNLGAVCLTLATLNTRFIFPLISIEGQRIWILGMIPGRRRDIIYIKYFYTAILSIIMIVPLTILSNFIIRSSLWIYFLSILTALLVSLTLSAISVGLGALYPDFKAESPSEIVSGFGGTLVLVLSIMYIVAVVGIEGYIGHVLVITKLSTPVLWALFITAILVIVSASFITSYLSLKAGIKNIDDMDF
ncbi:MAG: hypothetical protein KAI43_03835 [Candidatus Aureabacteria bacterium]|nr:hypothetical protein [Candidatus Auribacterota bacterium]